MSEHSFQEVMKNWKRMCLKLRKDCRECEIHKKSLHNHLCFCNKDTLSEDAIEAVEKIVMQWAEENPEPVYPTWVEYLVKQGVLASANPVPTLTAKAFFSGVNAMKPIPADTAEKLNLQPKEI